MCLVIPERYILGLKGYIRLQSTHIPCKACICTNTYPHNGHFENTNTQKYEYCLKGVTKNLFQKINDHKSAQSHCSPVLGKGHCWLNSPDCPYPFSPAGLSHDGRGQILIDKYKNTGLPPDQFLNTNQGDDVWKWVLSIHERPTTQLPLMLLHVITAFYNRQS